MPPGPVGGGEVGHEPASAIEAGIAAVTVTPTLTVFAKSVVTANRMHFVPMFPSASTFNSDFVPAARVIVGGVVIVFRETKGYEVRDVPVQLELGKAVRVIPFELDNTVFPNASCAASVISSPVPAVTGPKGVVIKVPELRATNLDKLP